MLNAEDIKTKSNKLIQAARESKTWREIGEKLGVTKQCVNELAKIYGCRKAVNEILLNKRPVDDEFEWCVYIMYNVHSPKSVFIGRTRHFSKRRNYHINAFKHNRHGCKKLQSLYNKYGKDSLEFKKIVVLKEGELDGLKLRMLEGQTIDKYIKEKYDVLNIYMFKYADANERRRSYNYKYPPKKVNHKNIFWHRTGNYLVRSLEGKYLGYAKTISAALKMQMQAGTGDN